MVHSNLVYTALFCPWYDSEALRQEQREWNQRHAMPLGAQRKAHLNEALPRRRLRIGYVSPSFREHVVGRNVLPLLREHDRTNFDIVCYSDANLPDAMTEQFRNLASEWRDTAYHNDAQLAAQVQRDGIDILIDLTLYMAGNRLLVFARKPAPVQVSFAGYPGTTGLGQIDYRLTDPYLEPPELIDATSGEQPIRLSNCFWCYDPRNIDPPVAPLPALANQYVTFGCLNNFAKVNETVVALWGRILCEIPNAQLVLLTPAGRHRGRTLAQLAGIDYCVVRGSRGRCPARRQINPR
jgi:predicted O-linked N-acetylglucosamine transferase (SPINDLY family)